MTTSNESQHKHVFKTAFMEINEI